MIFITILILRHFSLSCSFYEFENKKRIEKRAESGLPSLPGENEDPKRGIVLCIIENTNKLLKRMWLEDIPSLCPINSNLQLTLSY
jgi:hypothetical protein